ncbi:MAG: sialate O-acetylesterase [Planctomycetota bacterium]
MIRVLSVLTILLVPSLVRAELKMSPVFGNSMVVQRDKPIHVWGWTTGGAAVEVTMAGETATGKAEEDGRFDIYLNPMAAGGPHEMVVKADETKTFTDVLVGEVWLCSGQSNMAWPVSSAYDPDLESLSAKFPNIRLISVPQVASQEPLNDFEGQWEACTPESVRSFSAVGYFFGRQLHQTLDVPIGLIDNAWGGSAAEAWVRRDVLEGEKTYDELIQQWDQNVANHDQEAAMANFQKRLEKWQQERKGNRPRPPRNPTNSNHRPANLYNGVLHPVLGYTIRGAIWYQGESNAARGYQYRDLFPLMIQNWRDDWKDDFSFYWVQLADFRAEADEPSDSDWAELREAQTMAMAKLPNTGQAVIVDLGESADIHPQNKQDVAKRLARWALAKDYGFDIVYHSPMYRSMKADGNKVTLKFNHYGGGMDTFDVREPIGFTIAGEDKKFVAANARIVDKETIEVWSDAVEKPSSVRYAWADNPVANVQNKQGLPLTPFRTDDWTGVTEGRVK